MNATTAIAFLARVLGEILFCDFVEIYDRVSGPLSTRRGAHPAFKTAIAHEMIVHDGIIISEPCSNLKERL